MDFSSAITDTSSNIRTSLVLIANRDVNRQHWCLTAQLKSEYICDCFALNIVPKDYLHNSIPRILPVIRC